MILFRHNVDTLNIYMKEFIIFVCTNSTEIFLSKLRSSCLNYNLPGFFTDSYCAGVSNKHCLLTFFINLYALTCADQELGYWVTTPLKNHKTIGFPINVSPDTLKNHKATRPTFNVGPSSTRQRSAISMAFRWRADDCPFLSGIWILSLSTHQLKKQTKKKAGVGPPSYKTFWIRA